MLTMSLDICRGVGYSRCRNPRALVAVDAVNLRSTFLEKEIFQWIHRISELQPLHDFVYYARLDPPSGLILSKPIQAWSVVEWRDGDPQHMFVWLSPLVIRPL
jgi:hypothetical protein